MPRTYSFEGETFTIEFNSPGRAWVLPHEDQKPTGIYGVIGVNIYGNDRNPFCWSLDSGDSIPEGVLQGNVSGTSFEDNLKGLCNQITVARSLARTIGYERQDFDPKYAMDEMARFISIEQTQKVLSIRTKDRQTLSVGDHIRSSAFPEIVEIKGFAVRADGDMGALVEPMPEKQCDTGHLQPDGTQREMPVEALEIERIATAWMFCHICQDHGHFIPPGEGAKQTRQPPRSNRRGPRSTRADPKP